MSVHRNTATTHKYTQKYVIMNSDRTVKKHIARLDAWKKKKNAQMHTTKIHENLYVKKNNPKQYLHILIWCIYANLTDDQTPTREQRALGSRASSSASAQHSHCTMMMMVWWSLCVLGCWYRHMNTIYAHICTVRCTTRWTYMHNFWANINGRRRRRCTRTQTSCVLFEFAVLVLQAGPRFAAQIPGANRVTRGRH